MTNTITIERLPEGIRVTPALKRGTRVPAIASIVSKAVARHAINGALKALDAPGNPFTAE